MRVILEVRGELESGEKINKVEGLADVEKRGFTPLQEEVTAMPADSTVKKTAKKRVRPSAAKSETSALKMIRKMPEKPVSAARKNTTLLAGEVDESNLAEVQKDRNVVSVFEDPEIAPFPTVVDCDASVAKGTIGSVAKYLGASELHGQGYNGQGIGIGICDTGVNKAHVPVAGGWSPDPNVPPGQDSGFHGSMTGFDAKGMAPKADVYDIGVLKQSPSGGSFLSTALQGFDWAINSFVQTGKPQILSNSWGIYQEAWSPQYARDPNHVFTRKVLEAIRLGMIVTFAAGNCGSRCPDGRCAVDVGPGRSIWGANGHPWVITVAASNVAEQWIGYSSEGPSSMFSEKPNVAGISHFSGYINEFLNTEYSDAGTSAACPIVSGGIALLKQAIPNAHQFQMMSALHDTAKNPDSTAHDTRFGYGIVNFLKAYQRLQ